jgi:hypothetical protein
MQASVSWPGLTTGLKSFSYTVGHGTAPGVATIMTTANLDVSRLATDGDMVIGDGENPPIVLREMRLAHIDTAGQVGEYIVLHFHDRRKNWRDGGINGWYNQRDTYPDLSGAPKGDVVVANGGPYIPFTERTPTQMMVRCLETMNEQGWAIRGVDDRARVEVNWLAVPPAQALESVARQAGARLVYQPVANRVLVEVPTGTAVLRDDLPIEHDQKTFRLVDPPPEIQCVGGPAWIGDYWLLEAVGFEADGRIRSIWDLSYQPPGPRSWMSTFPGLNHWVNCPAGDSPNANTSKALAKQFVFRTWRLKGVATDSITPVTVKRVRQAGLRNFIVKRKVVGFRVATTFEKIANIRQIELSSLLYTPTKDITGQYKSEPAKLYGKVYANRGGGANVTAKNYDLPTKLDTSFTVDTARGLVTTSEPLFWVHPNPINGQSWIIDEPDLWIRTSARVRSSTTGQYLHGLWSLALGPKQPGRSPEIVQRPELMAVYDARRDLKTWANRGYDTNLEDIEKAAKYHMVAASAKYKAQPSATRTYLGLLAIDPDSAISQITWSIDASGKPTTTVSIGVEHATWLPTYPERRKNEAMMSFLKEDWVNNVLGIGWKDRVKVEGIE